MLSHELGTTFAVLPSVSIRGILLDCFSGKQEDIDAYLNETFGANRVVYMFWPPIVETYAPHIPRALARMSSVVHATHGRSDPPSMRLHAYACQIISTLQSMNYPRGKSYTPLYVDMASLWFFTRPVHPRHRSP